MKAAVLKHYGSPDQFVIEDIAVPVPEEGQLLIRNYASSVNPLELLIREGTFRVVTGLFNEPVIGADFSGTVVTTTDSRFKEGDEVFGCMSPFTGHAYAEMITVDADLVAPKPTNLTFTEAASLPETALTAWQALVKEGKVKAGDQVLINGCTGGVGCQAVQIAKSLGAIVTGTCRGTHMETARELGCDEVIDYETDTIPTNKRYQLIFETAGQLTWDAVKESLSDEGLLVITKPHVEGVGSAITAAIDLARSRMIYVVVSPNATDLMQIKELVEAGKLKPHIAQTFPIENISLAHQMQEDGGFVGKLALEIR